MKRRIWGEFHTIKGPDLTQVGEYTKEGIEGLALGFGQGRLGDGFRVTPGSGASYARLTAGWALLKTPDNTLHLVQTGDQEVDFSGKSAGTYDIVATVSEVSEAQETITPPPQTLPNGNNNPFYDARFSSYLLDVAVKQTVSLAIANNPHTPGGGEVVIATVVWDGSNVTQQDITELIGPPAVALADDSVTAAMLNPDTAGAGLMQESSGALAVHVDDVTLEVASDLVRVKQGGIADQYIGDRTVNDSQAPTDDTGSLTDLLSELANRILAITGKTNWYDDPRIALEVAAGKGQNETISGAWTFSTTPKVPLTPSADDDVPSKKYVDDTINSGSSALDTHKNANPLDHPDGSVTDPKIGNRTINDSDVPAGDTGDLTQLLSGLANRIKAITGEAGWRDNPATNLSNLHTYAAMLNENETVTGVWTFSGSQTTFDYKIRISHSGDASLSSTGHALQIGPDNGVNLIFDQNEIMARSSGAASTLGINQDGGDVRIGGSVSANGLSPLLVGSEDYKVWHEGNDGPGSGLDADTVDGIEGSSIVRTDATTQVTGGQVGFFHSGVASKFIWGVDGSHERIIAEAASGYAGFNPYSNSGEVTDGDLKFDFANGYWVFEKGPYVGSNEIIHAGNIGNYSSSNADQLDGLDSTQFLRSDANDQFTGNLLAITTEMTVGGTAAPSEGGDLRVEDGGVEIHGSSATYRMYVGTDDVFYIEKS